MKGWIFLVLLPIGMLLVPVMASGYTRSRSDKTGVCLNWFQRVVPYSLNTRCSKDVDAAECMDAVRAAFSVWDEPACTDLDLVWLGLSDDSQAGYDRFKPQDNTNLVVWREEDWPDAFGEDAIAITTVTFYEATGQILDADVELNGARFRFTSFLSPRTYVDIHNTLAHEVGHMLGIDHSAVWNATMYRSAPEGEVKKRDLVDDDVMALCCLYPEGAATPSCEETQSEGSACKEVPPTTGCGCSGTGPARAPWMLLFVALCCRWSRRRALRNHA